jgi:uncharacterized delta-60 repeat protein
MRRTLIMVIAALVVAGLAGPSAASSSPEGELDHTFGTDGFRVTDMGGTDIVSDVVPWGNRAVVFGHMWQPTAFVARYTAGGRLDRTFHRVGRITFHVRGGYVLDVDAAVTPDGHLVVMFDRWPPDGRHAATTLFRYGPHGWHDDSFGMDGRVDLPLVEGAAVAVDADGRILVAGRVWDGSASDRFAVVRLTAGGRRDHRFSGDGLAAAPFTFRADATGVMVDGRGRILLTGFGVIGGCSGGGCTTPFLLARFGTAGHPDTSFGDDGRVRGSADMGCTCGPNVALDAVGRIVLGENSLIARVQPDGTPDRSFGGDGVVDLFDMDNRLVRVADKVAAQPDGRVLAVVEGDDSFGRVTRLTTDGRLDATFGVRGLAPLPATEHRALLRALALDAHDRILAAGNTVDRRREFLNALLTRYT